MEDPKIEDVLAYSRLLSEFLIETDQQPHRRRSRAATDETIRGLEERIQRVQAFLNEQERDPSVVQRAVSYMATLQSQANGLRDAKDGHDYAQLMSSFLREDTRRQEQGKPVTARQIRGRIRQLEAFRTERPLSEDLLIVVDEQLAHEREQLNQLGQ